MKTNALSSVVIGTVILAAARVALAHPNHGGGGLAAGLAHPFTGIDHILAMMAVGLWAAQRGGRAMWLIPASFISLMVLGGAWSAFGGSLPLVESGIAASVLVIGLLVATSMRLPVGVAMAIVGGFAIFHGYAHMAEASHSISGAQYAMGFVLATAVLHLIGLSLGLLAQHLKAFNIVRAAGAGIAVAGILLMTGMV